MTTAETRKPFADETRIFAMLDDDGLSSHDIAARLYGKYGAGRRVHIVRGVLMSMRKEGWVEAIDDRRPITWRRTEAGSLAMRESGHFSLQS